MMSVWQYLLWWCFVFLTPPPPTSAQDLQFLSFRVFPRKPPSRFAWNTHKYRSSSPLFTLSPRGFISLLVPILPDITKLTPVMGGFAQKLVCIQLDKILSCRNSHICPVADVMCLLDSHVKHEGFCMEFPSDEIHQRWLKMAKIGPKSHFLVL